MPGICFVFGCSHTYGRDLCARFRFPTDAKTRKTWESRCRRADRVVNPSHDRVCACHFEDGKKENGPTIFPWNKDKFFTFRDPEAALRTPRKRSRPAPSESSDSELSGVEPLDDEHPHDHQDHSYAHSCNPSCLGRKRELQEEIVTLERKLAKMTVELSTSKQQHKRMTIDDIKDSKEKMLLYTSLEYDIFEILVSSLQEYDITYYMGWNVTSLSLADQLLMTLMKLRLGSQDSDLGHRFLISRATVSNVFHTLVKALHEFLFEGVVAQGMPSLLKCKGSMPASFSDFVSARVVIDATEITQDVPRDMNKQAACYSQYKSRHTVKAVTGVAPNAAIVFCSDLYPGCTSDSAITRHSELLSQLRPGDMVLADKGFTIFDQMPTGCSLNIPPFLTGKTHFTRKEAEMCAKIARARIHVERANERIKNFEILSHITSSYRSLSTKILQVCCCLVNIQAPLLQEIAQKYDV